jgi:uncharacterized membrane protein
MARKRSLKDAAADQLIEKDKPVPEAPIAPAAEPVAETIAEQAAPAQPAHESVVYQPSLPETPAAPKEEKKCRPPVIRIAIPVLIGCLVGYFFGVGQALGSANMVLLLIGLAAGFFFGRFFKIT